MFLTSSVQMSLKSHCGPQPKAKPLKLGELCDFKRIFKERCRQGTGATASELRALYGVSSCFAVASAVSSKVSRGGRRLRVNGVGRRQPSLSPPRSTADGPPCFPLRKSWFGIGRSRSVALYARGGTTRGRRFAIFLGKILSLGFEIR